MTVVPYFSNRRTFVCRMCLLLCILISCVSFAAALKPQWTYLTDEQLQVVDISANASVIAAGGDVNTLYVFDNMGDLLWERHLDSPIIDVATSPDGSSVTAMNDRGKIFYFNQSGGELWTYQTNIGMFSGKVTSFFQSPDASFTVSGNEYGRLVKINKTGALVFDKFLGRRILDVSVTNDGNWTLTGEEGGYSHLFDAEGNITWETNGFANHVRMSQDGGLVIIGGGEGSMGEFALYRDEARAAYQKMGTVNDLAITPRGTVTVVASEDGTLYRYDREGHPVWNYTYNGKPVKKVAIPSDASRIAAVTGDNYVFLVKNDGSFVDDFLVNFSMISQVLDISFAPDGSSFAAVSRDRNIYFFRIPLSAAVTTSTPITAESSTSPAQVSVSRTLPIPVGTLKSTSPTTTPSAGSGITLFVLLMGLVCVYMVRKNT